MTAKRLQEELLLFCIVIIKLFQQAKKHAIFSLFGYASLAHYSIPRNTIIISPPMRRQRKVHDFVMTTKLNFTRRKDKFFHPFLRHFHPNVPDATMTFLSNGTKSYPKIH